MMRAHTFVCPRCKGTLDTGADEHVCRACEQRFPIVCGVPDFRLAPDPFISLIDDRAKALHLFETKGDRSFEQLVRHYYAITPDDPPDLAEHWTRHHQAEVTIADELLAATGMQDGQGRALLDLGCSTGGMVVASARRGWNAVGIDVALRWLIIGRVRLAEAGVSQALVCANAEHLPFASETLDAVTANDLLEHSGDPQAVLHEARRVCATGARAVFTGNNRYAPLPEPQLRIWGVTQLPRRWQARYVSWRRPDVHRYRVLVPSAWEVARMLKRARFASVEIEPAPLLAPHWPPGAGTRLLRVYNRVRRLPLLRPLLRLIGPRLLATASARAR